MTTVKTVFDIAMGLMDEVNPESGATETVETRDYKRRTPFILTTLCGELYQFSDTRELPGPGRRPVCPEPAGFDGEVALDDFLARSVLPYGLAAHLLVDENPAAASFFQQRYQELIVRYAGASPSVSEAIDDLYGGVSSPAG